MRHSRSILCLSTFCLSAVLVAGCERSQMQSNALVPSESNAAGAASGKSAWMAEDAESRDLLYVSNRKDGSVYVYSYPQAKLVGGLHNVHAGSLCSDSSGDVFIPSGNAILQYSHGGTRPVAVLRNPLGGATSFCAVDPVTGNLAVSGGAAGNSGVAVFASAKGNATIYRQGARDTRYWSCAYDDKGNLFVEISAGGLDASAKLVELPNAARRLRSVTWQGSLRPRLGFIQWDGQNLAAESTENGSTAILRYSVNRGRAVLLGTIPLARAGSRLQFWIHDSHIIVPNQSASGSVAPGIAVYAYPGGDRSRRIIDDAREPQAAVVSTARRRKFAVLTYHYDNLRTGWNDRETVLTQQNVSDGSFGLLHTVTLDDQVDTQPLLVPNETTSGVQSGKHDVVYVTTESDTVYAIDASSGTVLFTRSLGSPVETPLGCNNNGPNVGIDGTAVIDRQANVMYVIAYTMQGSTPTYTLHELSLSDLSDVVSPVAVSASHQLTNGYTFTFNATYQRQRPGLLEANGNIYAGFGSFCDLSASQSRGWLLGWQAGSLTPLAANRLNDTQATSPDSFFLSSIWMSGYGVAADPSGNIYFVTGNSDYSGNTYSSTTNISETVAKVSPDLTQLLSFFTPSDVDELDQNDEDFGSGGVMLLPKGASTMPLAAAAGKEGTLFLMNRKSLGGYNPSGSNHVLSEANIGGCWCGPSYFDAASDSVPRIVGSGTNTVTVWKIQSRKLVLAGYSAGLAGGQDPGFFTSVSSSGHNSGAIIWAVARPQYVPGNVTLYAFNPEAATASSMLQVLYQAPAGTWTAGGGNANLVPVVANGKVYVASYAQLDIFGLLGSNAAKAVPAVVKVPSSPIGAPHQLTGTLIALRGAYLTLRTRSGAIVHVDGSDAVARERSVLLMAGKSFTARGTYAAGVLHASLILRAKPAQTTWPPDR